MNLKEILREAALLIIAAVFFGMAFYGLCTFAYSVLA